MSLLVRPVGIQPVTTTRRGFLRALGAGTALLATGCSDMPTAKMPAELPDAGMPARTTDAFLYPDQKILSLSERLTNLLSMDPRFHLYVEGKLSPINTFIAYCETNFGAPWTTSIVVAMERAADSVVAVEQKLKSQFNVTMFVPEVRLRVGTNELLGCVMAKADPLFITFWPPKPAGCSTEGLYLPAAIHEYGHFFSFYDPKGKQIIPTYTDPPQTYYKNLFDLEMAEMKARGYVERYHLGKIKYLPWFSNTLTQFEYIVLSELVANKVAATLVGETQMSQLFTSEFEAIFTPQQTASSSDEALLAYIFYCDKYKITKWGGILRAELIKRGTLTQQQIDSALAKQDAFYNSVELLDY